MDALEISQDVQTMIDNGEAFIHEGWMCELNLPGYNAMFSPEWETIPQPSQELVDELAEYGETPRLRIIQCEEGAPGRIGGGMRVTADNVPQGYYRASVVAQWE